MHSMLFLRISYRVLTIGAAAALFALAPLSSAPAYTLKTLHSFCNWANCGDGYSPAAGLLNDASGNLYGTTEGGGKYGYGVVFKLALNPNTGTYKEYVLHNFCARANCTDGALPEADLIMDVDGDLYGTTYEGGKFNGGIVFKLTHGANGWGLSVIHAFCSKANCTDGGGPFMGGLAYAGQDTGAPWDEFSPLFGTTNRGGAHDEGVVYQLLEDGSLWNYEVIHTFNPAYPANADPGPLLVDSSGNLFGVTGGGGKYGWGALYKLAAGTWKETTLHNFCAEANCADGASGVGRLLIDASGNLFGETSYGGAYGGAACSGGTPQGCGVVFERTAGGAYKAIYNFCSVSPHCSDGAESVYSGLTMDASGNLFGVTFKGGDHNGVVFELSSIGGSWTESVLHTFCQTDCTDGAEPEGTLILDSAGNLFGTTSVAGANGNGSYAYGTVFELQP